MNWGNDRTNFDRNIAAVIGINEYQNGIHKLSTPVNDANQLAELLEKEYEYEKVIRLFPPHGEATLDELKKLLFDTLPNEIKPTEGDRLLFYFAGHGIARNSEDGPAGYLVPQDAQLGKLETFLPMRDLNTALSQLNSHHLLVILDCCFAGNFRWSSTRNIISAPETIHREHYDRFIRFPAWQAITSAAHNQEALDFVSDLRQPEQNSHHSPFALALIEGLKDLKADFTGDGVIVAPELYMYLRDRLIDKDGCSELQTPGLWPLQRHDRGEFIFTRPGFEPEQLKPAPLLDKENNPYRGLEPFDEKHARFFFGRQELVEELYQRISSSEQSSSRLTVVSGISGSGKSSLVKAGLIPYLRKNHEKEWRILEPMRPGKSPVMALAKTFKSNYEQLIQDLNKGKSNQLLPLLTEWLVGIVRTWSQANPQVKLLLTIDQFEELITMSRKETSASSDTEAEATEQQPQPLLSKLFRYLTGKSNNQAAQKGDIQLDWQQFVQLLDNALKQCPQLHIVLTLRSDFEPRFVEESAFKDSWEKARFSVRPMRSDELRQAIEGPASEMALYFEPPNLVDRLIDEVAQMPGALPLLSFTLSELYIKLHQAWIKEGKTDRALTLDLGKFDSQGGIAGSLSRRANEIYESLDNHQKTTMRRVMLRMVTLQGGEPVRRQVSMSELDYPDSSENERKDKIIGLLDQARLVVKGKEEGKVYVEPAHDYLVRGWDKLQEWLSGEQETLSLQRRLTPAALEWKNKQEARFLWNADPYLDVLKQVLTDEKDNWFNQVEAEFVQKSVWRRRRNVNLLWGSVIGVILGLSGLTLIARIAQNEAQKQEIEAQKQEIDALRQASEANWLANNQLDALIQSLRAGKNLKENRLFQVSGNSKQREEVVDTLRKIVYGIRERGRMNKPIGELLTVTPDRNILVQNSSEQAIRYLNAESKVVMPPEFKSARNPINYNPGIISSPDGKLLATADIAAIPGSDGLWNWDDEPISGSQENANKNANVYLWDWENKKEIATFTGHQSGVKSFSFSPDSRRLAVVDGEDSIHLWDVESKTKINTIKKPGYNNIVGIGFTPDNELRVATFTTRNQENKEHTKNQENQEVGLTQMYGVLKLWDDKGNQLLRLYGDSDTQEEFGRAIFSTDGKKIVIEYGNLPEYQSDDARSMQIFLWDYLEDEMNLNKEKFFSELYSIPVEANDTSLAVIPDGKQLATTLSNNNVRFWDLEEQNLDLEEINHTAISVSLSADGKQLATADKDGRVGLLNLETNKFISLPKIPVKTKIVRLSADSKKLAIVGQDNTVGVWDLESEKLTSSPQNDSRANLEDTKFTINSIKFSPNSNQLAIERLLDRPNSLEKKVSIWDLKTNKYKLQNVETWQDFIFNSDNQLQLLAIGIELPEATGEFNVLTDLAGNLLINFKHTQTKCILQNRSMDSGIENYISTISNSSNSNLIASGEDNTICLKDLQGNEVAKLTVPNQQKIKSISLSGDGRLMAILLDDGSIKLWQIGDLDYLLQRGCNWVRHYLQTNPNVEESDRDLCKDFPPSNPSPQTTTANSSAPFVQPSAQNAPSPAPLSNNGQNTPSSSAPANAPARPQNVPSPTPSSNNGQNNYRQALSDRKQASKLKSVDVYINQGLTYHRQGKYKQAISNYSQAIALNPNSDKAYSNRAAAYNEQKDYPKAIADSSKAISLNPNYANAYINRGLAYYYQGNSQQAIANYNKAIELAPGNANAYNNRALAYTRLGNQQAAQVDKRKAAALSQRPSQ